MQTIPLIALIRLGVIIAVIALMLFHGTILTGKSYVYADRVETALKGFEDTVQLYEGAGGKKANEAPACGTAGHHVVSIDALVGRPRI